MRSPAIAILWTHDDGTSCVLSRRGTTLVLTLERKGMVHQEQIMESPREAMDVAAKWRSALQAH
jgi:hypothetical protein